MKIDDCKVQMVVETSVADDGELRVDCIYFTFYHPKYFYYYSVSTPSDNAIWKGFAV